MRVFSLFFLSVLIVSCSPKVPPYPYENSQKVIEEAQTISEGLERHVDLWLEGKADARIPDNLLPDGRDPRYGEYTLIRYQDIDPNTQWGVRKAEEINWNALHGSFPDPHATYLGIFSLLVPFGHKVHIEGEYPYARFFDIQITGSFDPKTYYYQLGFGEGEVPIVDVDIPPLSGNVNPYLPGANRFAKNRRYRVTYDMAIGDPTKLNPKAFNPPYRDSSPERYGSGIKYQGPWGDPNWKKKEDSALKEVLHGRGRFSTGAIWVRYYAIDRNKDYLGGVALPKVWYETPEGQKYFIQISNREEAFADINKTQPLKERPPKDPGAHLGKSVGWDKQYGIMLSGLTGIAKSTHLYTKEYVRNLHLGVTGRGENQPGAGGIEPHATGCTYINYLLRGMSLGEGKVVVLTGKMPTYPNTRQGARTMKPAQMRYWSLTSYDNSDWNFLGAAVHSIMDDEIILDKDRNYIIIFSREKDRPANATRKNGVTWVNWGNIDEVSWTLRWMSVEPDHAFALSPDEKLLPWSQATWSGTEYNPDLVAKNNHNGILKDYLPKVHYLESKDFENLGNKFLSEDIPLWR